MSNFGNKRAAPEYEKSKTAVWWDMDTCPVPDGYDGRLVRPSIEGLLKSLGCSGPVTITAMGNLENTPAHVLHALSSSGIVVQHYISELVCSSILFELLAFKYSNPAPATIMLISDKVETQLYQHIGYDGYNHVVAYTSIATWRTKVLGFSSSEWRWINILAEGESVAIKQADARYVLQKCTDDQSGESVSAVVSCNSCLITGLSVTDFTTHLSTREHKQMEIGLIRSRMPDTGEDEPPSKAKANTRKSKRLRKAFRTNHVLLLTKRRSRRGAREY